MTDRLEYKGYWYLPDNPDKKVAGVLTYIPEESIMLELIGWFEPQKNPIEVFLNQKKENIIHGIASNAKEITLVNCYASGSINFNCPFPIVRYNCQYLIIDKHIGSLAEPSFYKAQVLSPVLSYWCHPGALQNDIQFDENNKFKTITISFKEYTNDENTINITWIDENTKLYLKKGVNYNSSEFYLTPKIEQSTFLEIHKKNDSSINEFLSDISLYEQFLSLATLKAVECSKIYLYDRGLYQQLENGEKYYHKVELIYIQRKDGSDVSNKTKKHDFLFDYKTIERKYSDIIQKWFTEKEDIAPIRVHLVESIKHKSIFSSIDFLIVIQALEGFCTRFKKEEIKDDDGKITLRDMLEVIISEFSCIDKIKDDDICVQEVVDSRHYYSHFMDRSKKKHIVDGIELFDLTHKLRKLLICCLLQFIGFDYSQINEIFNNSNSSFLAKTNFI